MIEAARNITFKSANVQTPVNNTAPVQNTNLPASKPDEFVKQGDENKKEKKGLSTKAKIGIGVGIALAGTIAFLIYKGKFSEAKKLAENIEFTPAKTIDEAIAYGKKHLGIRSYSGFEEQDLEAINWVNEGLTNVSNRMKGKLRMPKHIMYCSDESWGNSVAGVVTEGEYRGYFAINKDFFGNINKGVDKVLSGLQECGYIKFENNKLKSNWKFLSQDMIDELAIQYERYHSGNASFKDKILLYNSLGRLSDGINSITNSPKYYLKQIFSQLKIKKLTVRDLTLEFSDVEKLSTEDQFKLLRMFINDSKYPIKFKFNLSTSPFGTIYHEMGHIQDMKPRCLPTEKFKTSSEYPKELQDWLKNEDFMQTANKISTYAASGPGEFIAETFEDIIAGRKLPEEVMDLYKKLEGPIIPGME